MKAAIKKQFLLALLVASAIHLTAQNMSKDVVPFKINVSEAKLNDLQARLKQTRWPDAVENSGWEYGADINYMRELIEHWHSRYDWRKEEARLNSFKQFQVKIDGLDVHFVYEKGKGKTSTPVVLLHGWPGSFVQMMKIIPELTAADADGHSFDVIIPSLIGYGFSQPSTQKGMTVFKMAEIFQKLMTEKLGYNRFVLRGSDLGAGVAKEWALAFPQNVVGLHLSGSNPYVYYVPDDVTPPETQFITEANKFMQAEGAYAMEHSTKPLTLSYGLNDSPVGLAAWMVEKFYRWSDNGGNLDKAFSKDDILTNISVYWFTQTIGSSIRLYYESARGWSPNAGKKVEVPTAFLMLKKDIAVAPREWEARSFNIVRWNVSESGGHFPDWEKHTLVAQDIREFVKGVR